MTKALENSVLTQERLRGLFDYDGRALIWRARPPEDFKTLPACGMWNTRYAGTIAGRTNAQGYICITVCGRRYVAHRLIFLREFGWMPDQIDHINHVRDDNRLANLRPANPVVNARNQKLHSSNTSGRVGVTWNKVTGKWHAVIKIKSRFKYLGCFGEFKDACAARAKAEAKYGFHPNHGRAQ